LEADHAEDAIVKHAPSSAETLDSLTQSASMFLDPTGAQVGEQVQGEEGIAYADLDLIACVIPKQFHDVVGGYQRFDIFDLKVSRERMGPENAFRGLDQNVHAGV
jgi:aliphatic nitrilase